MELVKYIITLIILIAVGILYDKYKIKNKIDEDVNNYELIKKYLLNDSSLANAKRPILWIHMDYAENARHWYSFGSRKTNDLNQPYLYLSIASIINQCGKSFNVILIDDNTFNKIIPGWTYEMGMLPNPIKSNFRQLALSRILYNYGGMLVPSSFICMKNLIDLYNDSIKNIGMFVTEMVNRNVTSHYGASNFYTTNYFMGCEKGNKSMLELIEQIEILLSHNYTDEVEFQAIIQTMCNKFVLEKKSNLVMGDIIGTKTKRGEPILIDDLLGNTQIEFKSNLYGVYVPAYEILKRTKFEWFARLNIHQVLESETIVGKLLLTNSFKN